MRKITYYASRIKVHYTSVLFTGIEKSEFHVEI